jgi:CRP-like cAMP-binding protein
VFYIRNGKVKLSVVSEQGKEAVVEILGVGDLLGYGCLAGQPLRIATATAITPCSLLRIGKKGIARLLHKHQAFSDQFISYIISRKIRILDNLVDRVFNSIEERLARALLLLADYGKGAEAETVIPKISHGTLAEMIGASRPRVNILMNKFRKLGFIDYNGLLKVHRSLLSVVLHDQVESLKAPAARGN